MVIPKALRDRLKLKPGDSVTFRIEEGKLVLYPVKSVTAEELSDFFHVNQPIDLQEARKAYQDELVDRRLNDDGLR